MRVTCRSGIAMIIVAWLVSATNGAAQPVTYDVILRGGTVLDGTGAAPRRADVAIRGDRIVAIGNVRNARARTDVNVTGKMIAPGFINVHSHADRGGLASATNMLTQGVTTVLMNADGAGPIAVGAELDSLSARGLALNIAAAVPFNSIWSSVIGLRDVRPRLRKRRACRS